jgi:tRNA-splicing ligase RtcB
MGRDRMEAGRVRLDRVGECVWEMPAEGDMRVPGRIYGDRTIVRELLEDIRAKKEWNALEQIRNVAMLPGIQQASLAMADVHPGYGFCIGGVGAFDLDHGVVTVAGVGFDINCGVRTFRTPHTETEIRENADRLAAELFRRVPAGVGSTGKLRLNRAEIDEVLLDGARFALDRGYGLHADLEFIEENGRLEGADPAAVSDLAKKRQLAQVGTLGSGNHYLEIQVVEEVFETAAADAYGLEEGSVVVSIHTGSRALGHQIGTDYLKSLKRASQKYGIPIREKELVGAPIDSPEGRAYLGAVRAGANCAFANRQAIGHLAREAFSAVLGTKHEEMGVLYEVAHNNLKVERHRVGSVDKDVLVHRKGSTRAFGPGRPEIPAAYRAVGQPVLVGGSMGTSSWILRGTEKGMRETFGSAIHGAGRVMSRAQAKRSWRGEAVARELRDQGIVVRGHSKAGLAEEAPGAYKDVDVVVESMERSGVNRKVVRLRPLVCVKG